ncbi:HK97 family phage prohead protease [Parasphingopyxis sp.]|uniref:HK97 family phage prohead protease n=1 Tax=Parasphingopyxis sp. TaxID=1920299 RepID=UPI00260D4110|nr:HK97 family phage prohead protease [Parasphingopyxis sp.]
MSLRFAGYAAVFDRPDQGGDVIRAGAFKRSLERSAGQGRDVPLLWQHERGHVIGRIETLAEDARGLRVIARLDDAKLAAGLESGTLGGLSFGYRVRDGRQGKRALRELIDVDLVEVSLVPIPMQPLARVHAVADNQTR